MNSHTTQELVSIALESEIIRPDLDSTIESFFDYAYNYKLQNLITNHDHDLLVVEWGSGLNYMYPTPIDTRKYNDETFPDFKIHEGNYLSLTRQVIDNPISDEQEGYTQICLTFHFTQKESVEDSSRDFDLSGDTSDAAKTLVEELKCKHFKGVNFDRVTFHIDQI